MNTIGIEGFPIKKTKFCYLPAPETWHPIYFSPVEGTGAGPSPKDSYFTGRGTASSFVVGEKCSCNSQIAFTILTTYEKEKNTTNKY